MFAFLQANSTELFKLSDLQLIAPEIILAVCACVVLVMEVILPYRKSKWTSYFALIGIAFDANGNRRVAVEPGCLGGDNGLGVGAQVGGIVIEIDPLSGVDDEVLVRAGDRP